jgi:hypothetical protein
MALDTTIGGTASDSYGTLAAYEAYGAAMGWVLTGSEAKQEANLRKAAAINDRKNTFIGLQQYQYQARAFPRLINDLVNDWPVNPDTIPQDIIYAQFEMAHLIQGGLDPFATIESSATSESIKVGPITIAGDTLPTGTPRVVAVEGLLAGYILGGVGQVKLVRG